MKKNRSRRILACLLCAFLGTSTVVSFTACNNTPQSSSSSGSGTSSSTTSKPNTPNPGISDSGNNNSTGSSSSTPKKEEYTVTFNYNYSGAPVAVSSKVEEGTLAQKPADPTREGYTFAGWYVDAACTTVFNFATAITANVEIYAHWIEASKTLYSVTFDMNYVGAPKATTISVEEGSKVADPHTENRTLNISSTDAKHAYDFAKTEFLGWYVDAAGTQAYDFDTEVNDDVTLYAKWSKTTYTFEAELVDLTGKTGFGYSISYNDTEIIRYDDADRNQSASMGLSVGYLYAEDLFITFKIYSEKAVENVNLVARLSSEFRDVYIAPKMTTVGDITYQKFEFLVNDEAVDYNPIALEGAKPQLTPNQRPFDDHTIGTISLQAGWNEIELYVANGYQFESTVNAMAPMIDCIYLTTDAVLTWEPCWSNLDNVRTNPDD